MTSELRDRLAVAEANPSGQGKTLPDLIKDMAPALDVATRGTPLDGHRFMRIALTELRKNPQLLACSQQSVLGGLMCSAQLGLEVGASLGQSWLIPFRVKGQMEAQWILGYRGIVSLAARGGVHVAGRAVHEADEFSYEIVDGRDVIHHKRELRNDRGPTWLWYATATWDGGYTAMVLNRSEVESYRARSKAKDSGPWTTDYDAMAIKTAVRRLAPWIPLSPQAADATSVDGEVIRGTEFDLGELAAEVGGGQDAIDASASETAGSDPADPADGSQQAAPSPSGAAKADTKGGK